MMSKNMPVLPPTTEFKSFQFERKSIDEDQGIITGYLSTYSNVDLQGDRVIKGAFSKTVTEGKSRMQSRGFVWPVLWHHEPEQPIGKVIDAEDTDQGLLITAQLDISTNSQGVPNNPQAVMVFSGFKQQYVSEFSMGYLAIQKDYEKGIRNLKECAILEASACTSLFAANPEAITTGVKSMGVEVKTVCGNTSGPIGPRDESWDGSKAEKQIWEAAEGEDGSIKASVAKKYFMVCDGDGSKKGDFSYPFWYVGDDPHICVGAVKAIAGAIQGSRGAEAPSGLKGKVETLYKRINAKYKDAEPLTPPWADDGKRRNMNGQRKSFLDHYNEELAEDLLEDLYEVWFNALCQSVVDAFKIGDQPEADISEALDTFKEQFMKDFVMRAIECNMAEYLSTEDIDNPLNPYGGFYGFMSRRKKPDSKAGRAISAANQSALEQHQTDMNGHIDEMKACLGAMQKKVSDLTQLWKEEGQGEPYGNDKSRIHQPRREPPQALTRQEEAQEQPPQSTVDDAIVADLKALFAI